MSQSAKFCRICFTASTTVCDINLTLSWFPKAWPMAQAEIRVLKKWASGWTISPEPVLLIWRKICRKHLESIVSPTKKMHISGVLLEKKKTIDAGTKSSWHVCRKLVDFSAKALWLMEAEMMCAVLWNYTVSSSALRLTSASHGLWETSSEAPMAIQRISWCFQTSWNLNPGWCQNVSNRPRFWARTCHPSLFISSLVAFLRAAAEVVPIDSPLSRP